jgi:hypothetical protein
MPAAGFMRAALARHDDGGVIANGKNAANRGSKINRTHGSLLRAWRAIGREQNNELAPLRAARENQLKLHINNSKQCHKHNGVSTVANGFCAVGLHESPWQHFSACPER